ncbi:MAG: glycosyl transferase group 1 [Burkholderiales bacterium]|nr:glycosyl transferase group 1 [Burkholderiales bacterium]
MFVETGLGGAAAVRRCREEALSFCFVAPYAWPVLARDASLGIVGGAEVQQCILARLLARQGARVSMITLDFGQPQRAEVDGIVVHKTFRPHEGVPVLRFVHPRLTATWRALAAVDADVYYLRSASMLAGVIDEFCRHRRKRSIYAAASDADFDPQLGQIRFARDRWLYRRGLARVDRIVVQNEAQREACRRHFGREAVLIPSCYELPEKTAIENKDEILWVGRMERGKRPELALEVARRLPHRRFVLVGGEAHGEDADAGYYAGVCARGRALGNVEMTGFLPLAQVERRFDGARVLLNTSVYEGMPNTFLQAWARGVPTVATVDVGAPVYPVVPDADAAAAEIERLFAEPAHWQGASRRCREHFEQNHSTGAVMQQYLQLLEALAP